MIVHRTNVAHGLPGILGLLASLFGNRRATRWMGATPQRANWRELAPTYQRVRALEADTAAAQSVRVVRTWSQDPRATWTGLYRIQRAIRKADAARRTSPAATGLQAAAQSPRAAFSVAAFPIRTRAA